MLNHELTKRTCRKQIDWTGTETRARGMNDAALVYAIRDCRTTADQGMQDDAGYYMDCASVYSQELKRRKENGR